MRPLHGLEPSVASDGLIVSRVYGRHAITIRPFRFSGLLPPLKGGFFMQPELLPNRLSVVMDALVNADSQPKNPDVGLTLWQTAWVTVLYDQWQDTPAAQAVLGTIEDLASGREGDFEDELLTMAHDVWKPNRNAFYAAGFQFGQQYATVDRSTRMAIAVAIASAESARTWPEILARVAIDDVWEKATEKAYEVEADEKDDTPGAIAWRKWKRALEELGYRPDSGSFHVWNELDGAFTQSLADLREYMFHQGRLDGEALSGGGAITS